MILGELIKTYRTEHHMSMDDFAKKCGLSKAYISILERNINPVNGKSPIPSLETIKSVSQAVGGEFETRIPLQKRRKFNVSSLNLRRFLFLPATFSPPKKPCKPS